MFFCKIEIKLHDKPIYILRYSDNKINQMSLLSEYKWILLLLYYILYKNIFNVHCNVGNIRITHTQ